MKSNHVPVTERLQTRIDKLYAKIQYGDYWTRKRFYPQCMHCGITNISCNMNDGGHYPGCPIPGLIKEIKYYESLLKAARPLTPSG